MIHAAHAHRMRAERLRIFRAFRAAKALAPEHARSMEELGLAGSRMFERMRNNRVIREVNAGKFYLDEDARREYQWLVKRWLLVPVILMAALLVYGLAHHR